MNYAYVYLGYTAIGLVFALYGAHATDKYIPAHDRRLAAGITFFFWPLIFAFLLVVLACVVVGFIVDWYHEPPA